MTVSPLKKYLAGWRKRAGWLLVNLCAVQPRLRRTLVCANAYSESDIQ
jgi:hypothetical protein